MTTHEGVNDFECYLCDNAGISSSALRNTLAESHRCGQCSFTFATALPQLEHLSLQHSQVRVRGIVDDCRNLQWDQEFADVTLVSEDGQQREAHKGMLAPPSPHTMCNVTRCTPKSDLSLKIKPHQ